MAIISLAAFIFDLKQAMDVKTYQQAVTGIKRVVDKYDAILQQQAEENPPTTPRDFDDEIPF